jgi:hypothetical protein
VILGPSIHYADAKGIESSDVSTSSLYAALAAGKDAKIPDTAFTAWADVRLSLHSIDRTDELGPKRSIRSIHC